MKDWEKELTKRYKGKTLEAIPQKVQYDKNYGYFFTYRNHIFIANLEQSSEKIISIKYARLLKKH